MVARDRVPKQVQTGKDSTPALLMVAESSLNERLTNSLGCPLNQQNSQVIRRIRHGGRRGGLPVVRWTRRSDRGCWADVRQPAGNLGLLTTTFAVRSVIPAKTGSRYAKWPAEIPLEWARAAAGRREGCPRHLRRCPMTSRR